jgi:hypothetical protein
MSNTPSTQQHSDLLASTILQPIFGQSLRPTCHTPKKRSFRSPESQHPAKQQKLTSVTHIQSLSQQFCCLQHCLTQFTDDEFLSISKHYADLNEKERSQFIISVMSATCVSTPLICRFKLHINGKKVCLTAFQKVSYLNTQSNMFICLSSVFNYPFHIRQMVLLLKKFSVLAVVFLFTTPLGINTHQMPPPTPTFGFPPFLM